MLSIVLGVFEKIFENLYIKIFIKKVVNAG
jgi:hypothetical protein